MSTARATWLQDYKSHEARAKIDWEIATLNESTLGKRELPSNGAEISHALKNRLRRVETLRSKYDQLKKKDRLCIEAQLLDIICATSGSDK